jgi:hypothetical protein
MLHFPFDTNFILMVFTKYIQMSCKSKSLDIIFERLYMGMIFLQKKKKTNQHLIYIIHISKVTYFVYYANQFIHKIA